jgi:chemotaxis protein MotB
MAGHGGGSWKVAYADFVTAMMAFFMVMWLTSQKPEVKEAVANYFQDPFGFGTDEPRSRDSLLPGHEGGFRMSRPGGEPPRDELQQQNQGKPLAKHLLRPGLQVQVQLHADETAHGVLITFPETSAELNEQARMQLRNLLPEVLGKPQKIEIRSYAARRPMPVDSVYQDPWQLCYARCVATMEYFLDHGIEANRIRLSQAGIHGTQAEFPGIPPQADTSYVKVFVLPELIEPPPGVAPELVDDDAPRG